MNRTGLRALVAPVCRGSGLQATIVASLVLLVVYAVLGFFNPALENEWRIDEGQRIAEGYFWLLLKTGDFSNPDWFRQLTIRSHPPVSKYFFGMAIDAAGIPPPQNLDLAREYDDGAASASMPERFSREYLPMRRPARLAAQLCNLVAAVTLFAILMRAHGPLIALLSQAILFRHYLFAGLLANVRSDSIQALLVIASIAPILLLGRVPAKSWKAVGLVTCAGAVAALAFQVRLNGGVALLMCGAFILWRMPVDRWTFVHLTALGVGFAVVSVMVNPYYWSEPRVLVDIPPSLAAVEWLPLRVAQHFSQQVLDLRTLLDGVEPRWHLDSLRSRMSFVASVFFSGKSGALMAVGILAAVLGVAGGLASRIEQALAGWASTGIMVIALWIPLSWEPYLLIVLPAAVLLASVGYGITLRRVVFGTSSDVRLDAE